MSTRDFTFERIGSFKHLGVVLTDENDMQEEIKTGNIVGNKCMFSLINIFMSKHVSRKAKVYIYKTVIRPIVRSYNDSTVKIYRLTSDEDTQKISDKNKNID